MTRILFIIFLFIQIKHCFPQTNLIYNGDFELYDTCPKNVTTPFDAYFEIKHCLGWYKPTYATSDYYNACNNSINGLVGVPNNTTGSQPAFSGSGYLGFYTYTDSNSCSCFGNWIEYVQSKLVLPLEAGHVYKITFYVSLAESGELAVSDIGAYFSANPISSSNYRPFQGITPQVRNSKGNYLTDTINWMKISGEFIAKGGEQYITIGNFDDTLQFDTLRVKPFNYSSWSYYYLDGPMELTDITLNIGNVFSPNGDGINDVFYFSEISEGDRAEIYDRWGIKIFETLLPKQGWDGRTSAGVPCSDGVYYYIILSGNKSQAGFIHLLH